jgi:hypothetical protein
MREAWLQQKIYALAIDIGFSARHGRTESIWCSYTQLTLGVAMGSILSNAAGEEFEGEKQSENLPVSRLTLRALLPSIAMTVTALTTYHFHTHQSILPQTTLLAFGLCELYKFSGSMVGC